MRTKTSKEPKKVPESDRKINLSTPKVVLDASDCAKLLDGTGKTSVILVERGGKMVPASSSSSLTSSSDFSHSTPASASFSSSPSLTKSPGSVSAPNSIEASPAKSPKLAYDASASSGQKSNRITTYSGQKDMADQNESANYIQDQASSEQSKVILKPPKKRRGNDKGAYEDCSLGALVNGETSHSVISPSPNGPSVAEVKEPVAPRLTPPFPVISTPSSSVQKHTIENLLQVSPSSSNNNNNSNSSNMNLISGPYNSHQTYNAISHPLNKTSVHELCSQTSIPPPPALPLSSSSSSLLSPPLSQHLAALPSASLSPTIVTSNVLHKNSQESNLDSALVYSYSNEGHPSQVPQTHLHVSTVLSSGSEKATGIPVPPSALPTLSSSSLSQSPSPTSTKASSFHQPPVQDEPINLSKSTKAGGKSNMIPPNMLSSEEHDMVDSQKVSESANHHMLQLNTREKGKIPGIVPSGAWKQDSDLAHAETNGIPHLQQEHSSLSENAENIIVKPAIVIKGGSTSPCGKLSASNERMIDKGEVEHDKLSHPEVLLKNEDQDSLKSNKDQCDGVSVADELNSDKDRILHEQSSSLLQSSEDSSKSEVEESKTGACSVSKKLSQEEVISTAKPKKSSKKKVEIPMDAESCAMRSSSYSESIDDVIHNFEYVSDPVDEIYLTEEEESILRLQFDDSSSGTELAGNNSNQQNVTSVPSEDKVSVQSNKKEANCKGTSKSSKKGGPKKIHKEKLSPSMQNVVNILASVAADIDNDVAPTEPGLLDLEAILRSLNSKCQKKILQLGEGIGSSEENVDAKIDAMVKRTKKTISDISLFYPSENVGDMDSAVISDSATKETTKDISLQAGSVSDKDVINKTKKGNKRKSDTSDSKPSVGANLDGKNISTSSDTQGDVSKPKKLKKKNPSKSMKSSSTPGEDHAVMTSQSNGESPFLSGSKMDTSDIGESIASTSGGSEQMTPVHEPDTKDEGVNTDHNIDHEFHDTGLESATEDKDNKPVRHYKKRLDFVKCPQCDHQSRGRSALSRHMKKAHLLEADMPYKCHLCTYGCTKMASLNRHLFTHSVFPCSRCDFKTDERDKLTEHVAEQHKDKLDMKLCKVCNRYIKCESFTIEQHTEKCRGPVPYKCTECSKEFKYASSLRVHYHTHFPDEPKRFKCELCDYRTNYKANLHKHHKNMHATRDRDVQCPDCNKLFSTEDNMRRHRKVHTLVRPFACEICKKNFKTPGALKGHQLIHTATRPFTCNIPGCNRTFRIQKFLKSHQEEFHRLVPKKFFCPVEGCNYSFFKRSHLKRHAITHTGERNFHCTWPGCSKSFRHADNLKVHFRGHTSEKPIQCHLCDFKCKQKNSLFWHKKKVHQIIDASVFGTAKHWEKDPKNKNGEKVTGSPNDEISDAGVELKKESHEGSETGQISQNQVSGANSNDDEVKDCTPSKLSTSPAAGSVSKSSGGSMDLYEFKSEGESEEEGPSPLRWENVKSIQGTPLPPPPKELLLKNELLEKKERDKVEKEEKRELLKKEKEEKKEQEKKEKAEKREQEKKEKAEKKELEKKEKDEKKEVEKKEKLEQKEKEKKDKEEQKEKEKKEKEEQKEKEKKMKEEQKEKEKKEKEEQKEKERIEREQQKEKEKNDKIAQKQKEKKDKERKRLEVKRLKSEAKKTLQKRSIRAVRGITRKTSIGASLKSTSMKSKRPSLSLRRKSPSRAVSQKEQKEEKKPGRGRKNMQKCDEDADTKEKSKEVRKKRGQGNKSPISDSNVTSRSMSPRAASPRGAVNKSPAAENKTTVGKGKKKASALPKRKPSARIKAKEKSQSKTKKGPSVIGKSIKNALKKTKAVKRGRPGKTKVNEGSKSEAISEDEYEDEKDDEIKEVEELEKEMETETETETVTETVVEESKQKVVTKELVVQEKKSPSRAPSPSSSEEDMLQGKASPYRDFSDAEDEEEEEVETAQSSQEPLQSEKAVDTEVTSEAPKEGVEEEIDLPASRDNEEDDHEIDEESGVYPEESSDDEGINDIPLTPPRAPAPPPMESSEDEMEPDTQDSSAPYSTPAPNTPFSVPGPNTPFSVPPPTNLMQQHSVHSEEMATGVSSVASLDMPSTGSVEMQQPQGSVESHPAGSVEIHSRNSTEMHPLGSVEMHSRGSVEMHSHGSAEMHPNGSVEIHPHGSVEIHPHGSVEMHPHGSVEMHPHGSVEMHPHGSVEIHPHGSVEMHPHGSVEMHPHGSVEMHPHGSVEMHPHGSVEMHPHGSVEIPPQGSVEMHPQGSVEMHHRNSTEIHPHASVDLPGHGSVEMHSVASSELHSHGTMEMHSSADVHSHRSLERSQSLALGEIHHAPQSVSQTEVPIPAELPSTPTEITRSSNLPSHDKFNLPPVLENNDGNTSEADKRYFDQYLKNLSAANNQAARSSNLIGSPESRDLMNKSPINPLQSAVPTSVITTMDSPSTYFPGQVDLRRMEAMVGERHHHDSLYARDTMSALSRMPDRQSSATPLLPTNHATPAPTFDAFSPLNPLHSSSAAARDNASYLRSQENIFATPPVTSSFMAEAMFQRQSMTTPFLPPPPQHTDRNSLSRIPDPAALRTNNTSSLLRRSTAMPGSEMFAAPTVPQAVPRHPLSNAWTGQEVRPTHWQNPYLPRQPNMATANNPFFPAKENYLAGREFMFDPSAVRSPTERGMFSSLASTQSQDSLQFDRFDLSNFFPSAVTPYGTSSSLDYTRTSHSAAPKPFDERYRQTAAAASAALPDFRGLPPTSGSTDMFPSIGVNSGFNLYPSNHPMPYHPQHMTDNMNSAFLTHPSTAQHAMLERDYAAAAAHRGLYPHHHQNASYPFIDERQYSGSAKLSHTHAAPTTVAQERDLMSRSAAPESQMQDPYRSMLYRY